MDGWKGGWKEAKAGLRIAYSNQKAWLLNGWVDGWMGGLKINYNGGPFLKMVGFLKIKFLIILKLNYNGGQFYKK